MSTERYQILSQLSNGLITDEEAERRLAQLGLSHRRFLRARPYLGITSFTQWDSWTENGF